MAGITFSHKGDFSKTYQFFNKIRGKEYLNVLDKYGDIGVKALREATPQDSGATANAWYYRVETGRKVTRLTFYNSNINEGFNVAIALQFGHGTRNGAYVEGKDYINPAMKEVMQNLADAVWKEVTD